MPKTTKTQTIAFIESQRKLKSDRFRRIAGPRISKILRLLDQLSHCSNPKHYLSTPEQIGNAFKTIYSALDSCQRSFEPKTKTQKSKNFFEDEQQAAE